jgi:hypothetical protein
MLAVSGVAAMLLLTPVAAGAATISLAWDASPGTVAGYKVYYGTSPNPHLTGTSVNVGSQTTASIPSLTSGVTYYFSVTAYSAGGLESVPSNEVSGMATAPVFSDDPLLPGVHYMKLAHISELRTRIDALRAARNLGAITWTSLVAQVTTVSASHITQMRSALDGVYTSLGQPSPTYSNPLAAGTVIKASDIAELRAAVKALE